MRNIFSLFLIALVVCAAQPAHATPGYVGISLPALDGTYLQMVPVGTVGGTHAEVVDETTGCNGTTDYVRTNVVGEKDSFVLSTPLVPLGAAITAIDIRPCASRAQTGAGTSEMKLFAIVGGTEVAQNGSYNIGSGVVPGVLPTTTIALSPTPFGTSTVLEIGAEYAAGTKGLRVSKMYAAFAYDTLTPPLLIGTNVGPHRNNLTWATTSVAGTDFGVLVSVNNAQGPFTMLQPSTGGQTKFAHTGLQSDQTFFYRVFEYNPSGSSDVSSTTVLITATQVPTSPNGLTATLNGTDVSLAWSDNSTNEEEFTVMRSINGSPMIDIHTGYINEATHTDVGLPSGVIQYRVRAANTIGSSGTTNLVTVLVP